MLIWNGTEYRQFLPIATPPAPAASKNLTRTWVTARNESIASFAALIERAKIRYAADPRYVGAARAVAPAPLTMPDWAKE